MKNSKRSLNQFIKMALLSAIAVVLMYIDFPIIPAFPWLKIDLSDVPALMGAFAFGPMAGVVIEFIKILLNLLLQGTQTGFVGETANFLIGVSIIVPASLLYWRNKSKKSAITGMVIGALILQVVAIVANLYFLLPAYGMKMTGDAAVNYVVAGLIPFNAIKSLAMCIVTYILYKKLSVSIFKVEANFGDGLAKKVKVEA